MQLTQTVSTLPTGPDGAATATLEQNYAVTNTGDGLIELILTKHTDMDMPSGGGSGFFLDDLVGVDFAEFVRPQVFARDDGPVTAYLTLRTGEDMWLDPGTVDFVYYAGKQLITPPPNPYYPASVCPMYDYGTDFQIWDNFGAPNCWKNFIPGVGHNAPGESPPSTGDAFIGMQVEFRLPVGDPHDVTFVTQYGRGPQDAPPQIMHERGRAGQTRPFSGYIDPRRESDNGVDFNEGLREAFVRFSDNVFDVDGSDVGVDNFALFETGGGVAPTVVAVEDANPPHGVYFRVEWDRPMTLQEWTTVLADVENKEGEPIVNQGDLGGGINEPDRVDIAFLPADINQSVVVNPLDVLKFKQFVNAVEGIDVVFGLLEDFVDLNRDGIFNPLDLLTLKQLANGVPPATQTWGFQSLNNPRP